MHKHLLALCLLAACSTAPVQPPTTSPAIAAIAPVAAADTTVYDLAARRAQAIGWLHDYAVAATYPTDGAGAPISVFVDAKGVRCPMAELVFRSGRADLVAAVQRDNNAVRLADVNAGPLHDWMRGSGLTRAEINMIQGAMNIDMGWLQDAQLGLGSTIAMQAQVRGKLEIAEVALRDNTAAALAQAAKQLPAAADVDDLVHAPIVGAVVQPPAPQRARLARR